MATKGYAHLNGHTYELAYASSETVEQLADNLAKHSDRTLRVVIDEQEVDLKVTGANLWASGAWLKETPPAGAYFA